MHCSRSGWSSAAVQNRRELDYRIKLGLRKRTIVGSCMIWLAVASSAAWPAEIPMTDRKSDSEFMSRDSRAMQEDDTANPGMLGVLDGEELWSRKAGESGKSCADCHGDAAVSMKGVAARYPAFDADKARPVDLEERINLSRANDQKAAPFRFESRDLVAITAYIARQSRGMPIAVGDDARTKPFIDAGRKIFEQRLGQLNLSCAQCHDDNWGKHINGNILPQGHPTGYPIYRLEWQTLGSLQRRLRNCMSGMRADLYPYGAPEMVNLELFLMWRARGMAIESPAVRP
jgi:sulfur-oxidizing protein SoxA